jgi:hypothetical protein
MPGGAGGASPVACDEDDHAHDDGHGHVRRDVGYDLLEAGVVVDEQQVLWAVVTPVRLGVVEEHANEVVTKRPDVYADHRAAFEPARQPPGGECQGQMCEDGLIEGLVGRGDRERERAVDPIQIPDQPQEPDRGHQWAGRVTRTAQQRDDARADVGGSNARVDDLV